MADGNTRGPRPAAPPTTPAPGGLDSIAVSWYRWRLLSGYYDSSDVLNALSRRIIMREWGRPRV